MAGLAATSPAMTAEPHCLSFVMPALVAGIHVFFLSG
jgi:hypothetical protein